MKKKNEEDASVLRTKSLKEGLRHEIEKYFVDHECTTRDVMNLIPMALYDIIASIAKTEEISHEEVFGRFVKFFGVWDYLKTTKEG